MASAALAALDQQVPMCTHVERLHPPAAAHPHVAWLYAGVLIIATLVFAATVVYLALRHMGRKANGVRVAPCTRSRRAFRRSGVMKVRLVRDDPKPDDFERIVNAVTQVVVNKVLDMSPQKPEKDNKGLAMFAVPPRTA